MPYVLVNERTSNIANVDAPSGVITMPPTVESVIGQEKFFTFRGKNTNQSTKAMLLQTEIFEPDGDVLGYSQRTGSVAYNAELVQEFSVTFKMAGMHTARCRLYVFYA